MPTSTISNIITDPRGIPLAGVGVTVQLQPGPGFRLSDGSEVSGSVQAVTNAAGLWSLALERNSNITPAGSYWLVSEDIPAGAGGQRSWRITVGAVDANLLASTIVAAPSPLLPDYLTTVLGDARYWPLALDLFTQAEFTAFDALAVHKSLAETITGVKTFAANPVFNAGAIPASALSDVVTLSTAQTITGAKTFNAAVVANATFSLAGGPSFFASGFQGSTQALIPAASAAVVALTVRGAVSQSNDLQQWQNSAGTVLASIGSAGVLNAISGAAVTGNLSVSGAAIIGSTSFTSGQLGVVATTSGVVGVVIKGAVSQTADLQQWQNSAGTVLSKISPTGAIRIGSSANGSSYVDIDGATNPFINIVADPVNGYYPELGFYSAGGNSKIEGYFGLQMTAPSFKHTNTNAGSINTIIRGAATQTADLTQWQNSAGTVLARVGAAGNALFSGDENEFRGRTWINPTNDAGFVGGFDVSLAVRGRTGSAAPVIVARASAQTADTQQWWNGAGAITNRVSAGGDFFITGSLADQAQSAPYLTLASGTAQLNFRAATNTFYVRGAAAQTTDLQQWQNSAGTALSRISAAGDIVWGSLGDTNLKAGGQYLMAERLTLVGRNTNYAFFNQSNEDIGLIVHSPTLSAVGVVVRGLAGQTGNLTQWRNSANTMLASVDGGGNMYGASWQRSGSTYQTISSTGRVGVNIQPTVPLHVVGETVNGQYAAIINSSFAATNAGSARGLQIIGSDNASPLQVTYGNGTSILMELNPTGTDAFRVTNADSTNYTAVFTNGSSIGKVLNLLTGADAGTPTSVFRVGHTSGYELASVSSTGAALFTLSSSTVVGLTVKGATTQTGDLQQWQNSAGGVLAYVDSGGVYRSAGANNRMVLRETQSGNSFGTFVFENDTGVGSNFTVGGSARGNYGVASANRATWYTGNAAGIGIMADGGTINFFANGAFTTLTGTAVNLGAPVSPTVATSIGLKVRGFTSQTADLQQWQNSAGTVLAFVDAAGAVKTPSLKITEGTNAKQGVATLTAGTVTVTNTSALTASRIHLTGQDNNVTGALRVSARVSGTSFTITSSNAGDSGVVAYTIIDQ